MERRHNLIFYMVVILLLMVVTAIAKCHYNKGKVMHKARKSKYQSDFNSDHSEITPGTLKDK